MDHRRVRIVHVKLVAHQRVEVGHEVLVTRREEHDQHNHHGRHSNPEDVPLHQNVEADAEDIDGRAPDDVGGRDDEDPVFCRNPGAGAQQPVPVVVSAEQDEERREDERRAKIGSECHEHELTEYKGGVHEDRGDPASEHSALEDVFAASTRHKGQKERVHGPFEGAQNTADDHGRPDAGVWERNGGGDISQGNKDHNVEGNHVVDPHIELRELANESRCLTRQPSPRCQGLRGCGGNFC